MRCSLCLARRARRGRARAACAHLTREATSREYIQLEIAGWWLDWLDDRDRMARARVAIR
jgi:hypothetical protein